MGTESRSNVTKWGNPLDVLRTYKVTKDVTVYYRKVANSKKYQVLFPRGLDPTDVLTAVDDWPLR